MRKFPLVEFKDFPKELLLLRRLGTSAAVQDFLNTLPFNFEKDGETYRSPSLALRARTAHCMEGALIAAAAFWLHGRAPLLMDLATIDPDVDHVVALFKEGSRWGAVSKANHGVLRYRDPIYRDPREIAMSYFNEYFLDSGVKTMRSFSKPFDLSARFGGSWLADPESLYRVVLALDRSPHTNILGTRDARVLRRADPVEIEAGKIIEWKNL